MVFLMVLEDFQVGVTSNTAEILFSLWNRELIQIIEIMASKFLVSEL